MENPIEMDDLGSTSIERNLHMAMDNGYLPIKSCDLWPSSSMFYRWKIVIFHVRWSTVSKNGDVTQLREFTGWQFAQIQKWMNETCNKQQQRTS